MGIFKYFLGLLICLILLSSKAEAALDGHAIMLKNDEARKLREAISTAELKTFGGEKKDNDKKFTWWRKLQPDALHYNTLTRFHEPPTIRGQGILFQEHLNGENEILLYLPTFKKIRRVENQEQSGSFMGSVFSYSDMTMVQIEDYKYNLLKEEKCPVETKLSCYVIEQIATKDAVKERFAASKFVNWIRKDNFMTDQREYYDLAGKLSKRLTAKDTRLLDPKGNHWLSFYLRMDNLQTKRTSEMKFEEVKVNTGIADAIFSQQNLQRAD